jgi:aryl-alcohol dehydrogenase-like predicted oxidoreductase
MEKKQVIETRTLGKTGIQVTPIGLGVMELAGGGGLLGFIFPVIPPEEKNAIIKAALTQQKCTATASRKLHWQPD